MAPPPLGTVGAAGGVLRGGAVSVYMDGGHVAQNQCRALRPQGHAAGHPAPVPGPLHRPPPGDQLPDLDGQHDAGRRGRYRHLPAAREHVGLPAGTHAVSRRGDAGRHRCRDLSGPADAAVRADGGSRRSAEAGQYAQRRDVDLSHAARALHRLAADGLLQDSAEGTGGAGADRRRRPLWRHDPGDSPPLHAGLHFRRHLCLHASAERVPLRAALSQPFERANRADRSRGRADPRGRLLLGPADGRGAAGLRSRRPHLFVLREVLRRRPHGRRRQGLGVGLVQVRVPRVLVVAGASSGVGKTTVTLGLLEAFRRRGLTVQAFKVGPDFIDPGFHTLVTERPSYNLDGWMCGRAQTRNTVARQSADADLVVIEGMMGCFDGVDGTSEDGSTAQIAKWLDAPIVLVIDASTQSRSAAAVVLGFERFDPELRVGAVIANRVGGDVHARWLRDAIASSCRAVPVGAIGHDASVTLPERHLGLVTAAEGPLTPELRRRLGETIERSLDLDRLLEIAAPLGDVSRGAGIVAAAPRVRIGVARDAAFQFYYTENLDLLRAAGADLVFWSPRVDRALPDVDGIYFGGGYPELHAPALTANVAVRASVRAFAGAGKPIYAECGGVLDRAETVEGL